MQKLNSKVRGWLFVSFLLNCTRIIPRAREKARKRERERERARAREGQRERVCVCMTTWSPTPPSPVMLPRPLFTWLPGGALAGLQRQRLPRLDRGIACILFVTVPRIVDYCCHQRFAMYTHVCTHAHTSTHPHIHTSTHPHTGKISSQLSRQSTQHDIVTLASRPRRLLLQGPGGPGG